VAEGRAWVGDDAKAQGLVDEMGGIDAAIAKLAPRIGVKAGEVVALSIYPEPKTFVEVLLERGQEEESSFATRAAILKAMQERGLATSIAPRELRSVLNLADTLLNFRPGGGMLYRMPTVPDIR
jgi:ClpP class serine protease